MAKERSKSTSCLKKLRNTPENVITIETSLSSGKILDTSDSSTAPRSRKSSNRPSRRCLEQPARKSNATLLEKNISASGSELQRLTSRISHSIDPVSQENNRDPCEILSRSNNTLNNSLVSNKSNNVELPSNNLITPKQESGNDSSTTNREQASKVSTDSSMPKIKSRSLRKKRSKNYSKLDQEPKSSADTSGGSNRQVLQKVSSNDSTRKEQISKTPTEAASIRSNSRGFQSRSQNNSSNEKQSKKISANRISASGRNKPAKRTAPKTSTNKAPSRSESINRQSEANNLPTELTREQTPRNEPPTESANICDADQNTNSNAEPISANTINPNQTNPLPNNHQESATTPPNKNQVDLITNDENSNTPAPLPTRNNMDDDDRYTSPSERQPNPEGNIQQSRPETRTQPISADPNSSDVIRRDLEAWLQNAAKRSDNSNQPRKPSAVRPYLKFPTIRPCDKDITNDPEDCKRKLEEKLNRMYKLKQTYYSDPQDNIPFIDLTYTKEGVFVDEPIERAFVYSEEILKMNAANSRNSSRISSLSRSNQSESVFFSPQLRLNMRQDKGSVVFLNNRHLNKESTHLKWMEMIPEESETNNMENIMHEFHHKLDLLENNIRTIPLSSETSSVSSEPVRRPQMRFIIPNRSSRFDKYPTE